MENNYLRDIYSTSDIALAAVISLYYPIKSINKSNPKKVEFVFSKDKNFDLLIERYWRSDLDVDPRSYFVSLKELKNRIYNE